MSATTTARPAVDLFSSRNDIQERSELNVRRTPALRTRSTPAVPRNYVSRSPTDSSASSDTETDRPILQLSKPRGRNLDRDTEQKLHEAVSSIKLTRSMSPAGDKRQSESMNPDIPAVQVISASASGSPEAVLHSRLSHTKSASLQNLEQISPAEISQDASCAIVFEPEDLPMNGRPHRMVRKKSGELVRSSLKLGAKSRRPASMPSTPAYTKTVHFDRKLEHVRHFLHSEKPAAVSANTSPTQNYFNNTEFPFRSPPSRMNDEFELSIELPNFVPEAQQPENDGAIIKVETVYLSTDKRGLMGRVAVRNLAFQKSVAVRYTLDDWRTTSETAAEYTQDVRRKQRDDAFDRFLFHIRIDDFAGVTDKTMHFCVRYHTAGQDYWDSNNGQNFRVEFHKQFSTGRRHSDPPLMAPVRKTSVDDIPMKLEEEIEAQGRAAFKSPRSLIFENIYDDHPTAGFEEPDHEKPLKIKTIGKKTTSGDSFSNRYDFGASLSAAIAAANSSLQGSGDEVTLKNKAEHVEHVNHFNPYFSAKSVRLYESQKRAPGTISPSFPPALDLSGTDTPVSSGEASPVPGLPSRTVAPSDTAQAYQSLLDKYCFVWK
ncbi:putative Protein phosphatase regulatory subunit Gac1 [Taphrina deformans PYCC 5710]|uniref:CBM21 domain-containing protein n=1 Tax=Taphrina deformans (strain PYCC 5710 / ATCC 11124 / CBS 356.35 / IMI 108563 / JCM 9778 / NBRC 8474) TaxID=1097556 RepID=R5A380_TAPDE|nr:putative Protein phosphatase regulatory subunit Gac1 [Taphrina deformans PYCC 5710]|eukprot:CCX35400.1 putative Protein phosphatase regulatory subunit Gac1 [Taphrina deformans PYCC 5710]